MTYSAIEGMEVEESYPVGKLLQALGQAGKGLEAGASLGDEGEGGGRASEVSARILCASSVAGLVCEGTRGRSWSVVSSALR
jgi:hypothetical protein